MSMTQDPAAKTILTPIEIWEVLMEDGTYIKFFEPLLLQPEILPPESPTDRVYMTVDAPDLNISVHADNLADLRDFVLSDIRFVWQRIVAAPDAGLNRNAAQIKQNWLAIAEAFNG